VAWWDLKLLLFNQDWWADELRDLGHEVLTCGDSSHLEAHPPTTFSHIDNIIKSLPNNFVPDVILWLDNSAPVFFQGFENCSIPIIFYSVDAQHHYGLHSHLSVCFDHILLAQKDYLPYFTRSTTPVTWLPLWASRYVEASDDKRYEATFVGTLNKLLNPRRVEFFDKLSSLVPLHLKTGDFACIFPHAEIVVNQTVKLDLNFRVFEAMMCGSLLLTEHTENGLLELFQDGTHLVTYPAHDAEQAATKIQWLLNNPEQMRAIARQGREEILAKHLPKHRAQTVHNIIQGIKKSPLRPERFFAAMINHVSIATITHKKTGNYPIAALIAAMSSASQALYNGVCPDDIYAAHLIRTSVLYDQVLRTSAGGTLIRQFSDAFPDHYVLRLAKIRLLLNSGEMAAARDSAEQLGEGPPRAVFEKAEYAVNMLLQDGEEGWI
jgi:hypothetical protein